MKSQSKWIIKATFFLVGGVMVAGCDHQPRVDRSHTGTRRATLVVDTSQTVAIPFYGPSILRESVDPRCFCLTQKGETQVVACPRDMQLASVGD